jgi:hypothetical protein
MDSEKLPLHMIIMPVLSVHPRTTKIVRRAFTPDEDALLLEHTMRDPKLSWSDVALRLPGRTARQCRERWAKYLKPDIRVAPWTDDEDNLLLRQIQLHGHRWATIALAFVDRSDNDVKNRWYSHLRDCLRLTADGRYEIMRDSDGNRVHWKAKRKRTCVSASTVARRTLERKMLEQEGKKEKVILPQLCAPDWGRLCIPDLIVK